MRCVKTFVEVKRRKSSAVSIVSTVQVPSGFGSLPEFNQYSVAGLYHVLSKDLVLLTFL